MTVTPAYALLGSGEFEPWTEQADRWLLERATGSGRVLILPSASAPEGDKVFDMWASMGLAHYQRLGIECEVVRLKTRADAERPGLAAALDGASMAFFSGGNPAYLAETLDGTAFWHALLHELGRGMAYAGCSAGVACLGELAPDSSRVDPSDRDLWHPGLRLFPKVLFGPHWNMLDQYLPGITDLIVSSVPPDCRLVTVDERTALVGDGHRWQVMGSGQVQVLDGGSWTKYPSGESFEGDL
jgi:cyanophycinase